MIKAYALRERKSVGVYDLSKMDHFLLFAAFSGNTGRNQLKLQQKNPQTF